MSAGQAIALHDEIFSETHGAYFVCRMRVADVSYFKDQRLVLHNFHRYAN